MEDELLPCRVCFEDCGYIEDEGGWCVYAICGNCGSATAFIQYDSDNDKLDESSVLLSFGTWAK